MNENDNLVSVRIKNSYDKSFSIAHNLKTIHRGINKRIRVYFQVKNKENKSYEEICKTVSYFEQYKIIRELNIDNYIILDNEKISYRRDLKQEIQLLELSLKHDTLTENEKINIKKLIVDIKAEEKKYLEEYKKVNNEFTKKINEIKKNHITEKGRKLRSDRRLNFGGIITFGNEDSNLSRNEMNDKNQEEMDNRRNNTVKGVLKELGLEGNKYYLVKHLDEQQIHYHFEFIGYNDKEKKLIRKDVNQQLLIKIQDLAGEEFKSLDIRRGNSKWLAVQEYCEKNNIVYTELSSEDKYKVLKICNVKNQSLKEFHTKANNDLKLKNEELEKETNRLNSLEEEVKKTNQKLNKSINLNNLLERVEAGTITIKQIKEMKEKYINDKEVIRVLNNRQRRMNNKNNEEKYNKNISLLKKNLEKLEEEIKNKEIIFKNKEEQFYENIVDMSTEELERRQNLKIEKDLKDLDETIENSKTEPTKGGATELVDLINKRNKPPER